MKSVQFRFTPTRNGRFEIRLAYTANRNRATNVPVTIDISGKLAKVVVDQRKTPVIDNAFISLGSYELDADDEVTVTISNAGANGYVVADAVQVVPIR